MPKSYRIRTEVGQDKYINVQLEQDFEQLEILSLKINEADVYTRVCSDYGVVVGRVLVNGGFGVPNAKVSVFIPLSSEDETNPIISELYPYKNLSDLNEDGYRYNLLPKDPSYSVHAATGTFPTRQEVLLDQSYIEVYDKYYKFSVKTNDSGDFMIFGVPTGTQTLVMDVDLSDIGCFSLSPQDLVDSGVASPSQVNGNSFKTSSNLSELPQIKTLNKVVEISPFWGDVDICQFGITRVDFDLTAEANIKIEPTAIFMGSIISTSDDDALKTNCKPKNNTGNLCELISGPGQILAIRQTIFPDQNNLPILETYEFEQNGKVIDGDGSFLVKVPMNIDYVVTNEFGQQIISNDPTKGIPTKGKYRFKFKWENEQGLQNQFLRANFLVPNIKEHGWNSSSNDPFDPTNVSPFPITLPVGVITGSTVPVPGTGGLLFEDSVNTSNISVIINGQPYYGDITSIPVTAGNLIQIVSTPIDDTQPQSINFTFLQQSYFEVLKSYAFSLDWDDYNDVLGAINCEDTFYEFNYNKVYTTAMFLDRYKNGLGRARHLGIKEIDNRTCKTTVNTFPVNDIIRNFDFLFFLFNVLINVLAFPMLSLLFIAHLIAFMWPILKFVLLFLALRESYEATVAAAEAIQTGIQGINAGVGIISANAGGPVINAGWLGEALRLVFSSAADIVVAIIKAAFAYTVAAIATLALFKIKNFPRISLPMLSYPECNNCECKCPTAAMGDDFDLNTINSVVQSNQESSDSTLATSTSFLAPINISQTYVVDHPNLENRAGFNPTNTDKGWFNYCVDPLFGTGQYKSLVNLLANENIEQNVIVEAQIGFRRLFSGWDDLSSPYFNGFKAPQGFVFGAEKNLGSNDDDRYYGNPKTVPYPQKLNEFNTRDKYFNSNGGVNQITTTVNPTLGSSSFKDNVIVLLAKAGTTQQIGVGNIISFNNPKTSPGQINLTGATLNQFNLNSVTGVTLSQSTPIPLNIQYADPNGVSNLSANIFIIQSGDTQGYMQFLPDLEYFQVITGMTIGDFELLSPPTTTNPTLFHSTYLKHRIEYEIYNPCPGGSVFTPGGSSGVLSSTNSDGNAISKRVNKYTAIEQIQDYQTGYEVVILNRGVDPYTSKQTIKYDLSKIFGYTAANTRVVEGSYYLNVPIKATTPQQKPRSHNTIDNATSTELYFPSYVFTPDSTIYSAFTSLNPYYYLSTDDTTVGPYVPVLGGLSSPVSSYSSGTPPLITSNANQILPKGSTTEYFGGSTFIAINANINTPTTQVPLFEWYNNLGPVNGGATKGTVGWIFQNNLDKMYKLYSGAYYRYTLPGVDFTNSTNIVMRSDRLPTSSCIENGVGPNTGYALHQNNNFCYYTAEGDTPGSTVGTAPDLPSGDGFDTEFTGLTQTLTCENMLSLFCYTGSGINVGTVPDGQCTRKKIKNNGSVEEILLKEGVVINGCYCLLNYKETENPAVAAIIPRIYLIKDLFANDAALFLEWKTRFTITFAACRGIFAQTFQNNWINGVLYMYSFNKTATYPINDPNSPNYNYCDDVILFNDINNGFYYRSSPWNGSKFIGKNSPSVPSSWPSILVNDYPGIGYNDKQIQFPTTIADLGPRESFISEICNNSNFNSYFVDKVKSTSYQDLSDLVQVGFLSRILNDGFRQKMLPITNSNDDSEEGSGIIQFFNSKRQGDRIDGDFAQMLSVNSEWRISPFLAENYPASNSIYFGNDNQAPPTGPRPVFGVFFESEQIDYSYRRNLTPGFETLNFSPLLQYYYGYPKTQDVPHYKWEIKDGSNSIFGSENNNWNTNVTSTGGFYTKGYQDLDFNTSNEYFQANPTPTGFLTNFTPIGIPEPARDTTGKYVVGAPYHFYFGLNNGKTAIDKFVKLYITTEG
jgi:hypothetical protein